MKSLSLLVLFAVGGCSLWYDLEPVGDMAGDLRLDDGGGTDQSVLDEAKPDLAPECETSLTCPSDKPVCDTSEGKCRSCVSGAADDAACVSRAAATPYCGSSGTCVECLQSMQCGTDKPVCSSSGACGACSSAADDPVCLARDAAKGHCEFSSGPNLGRCVACTSSAQCASAAPVCELAATDVTRNTCRGCVTHDECASKVCNPSGACELADNIIYVNNRTPDNTAACSGTTHAGTLADPYCQIGDGITNRGTKPVVRVLGSATTYNAVNLTAIATAIGPLTIVGPGRGASTPATVSQDGLAAVVVSANGANVTVTLDGMDLIGSNGATKRPGLSCTAPGATATVSLRDSAIHDSGGYGVDSSGCALTLDANVISSNGGGGISVNGGSITASNNLIVENGNSGPGVLFVGAVGGTWWFNTIAGNLRTGSNAAGFSCAAATASPTIQASIVWGNTKDGSGASVGSGCSFTYTDIDDTTTPTGGTNVGNFKADPTFTTGTLPTSGYRITATSPAANVVTTSTGLTGGALPTHDVDGNTRPRAATGGYDVGAAQAP